MLNTFRYIVYNLENPIAAINTTENILNKVNSLEIFPYWGALIIAVNQLDF